MGELRIRFDEKEALRYFGARPGDQQAQATVDRAFCSCATRCSPALCARNGTAR
mgnify:CR=1 FL=1